MYVHTQQPFTCIQEEQADADAVAGDGVGMREYMDAELEAAAQAALDSAGGMKATAAVRQLEEALYDMHNPRGRAQHHVHSIGAGLGAGLGKQQQCLQPGVQPISQVCKHAFGASMIQ
jgi:hypothetical protein